MTPTETVPAPVSPPRVEASVFVSLATIVDITKIPKHALKRLADAGRIRRCQVPGCWPRYALLDAMAIKAEAEAPVRPPAA